MNKEKDSKPFYKKVWFWILVAILAIGGSNALTKQTSSRRRKSKCA